MCLICTSGRGLYSRTRFSASPLLPSRSSSFRKQRKSQDTSFHDPKQVLLPFSSGLVLIVRACLAVGGPRSKLSPFMAETAAEGPNQSFRVLCQNREKFSIIYPVTSDICERAWSRVIIPGDQVTG